MDAIQLWHRGDLLREVPFDGRPLDVGRAPSCDLVVGEPGVAERHLQLRAEGGTVLAYDLAGDPRRRPPSVLGRALPLAIGREHSLVRVDAAEDPAEPRTERLGAEPLATRRFVVRVGTRRDARSLRIGPGPVTVGSGADNTLVVHDRAVSARHLVLTPNGAFVRVADAGSRNGTFVDGERIHLLDVGRGRTLRIGRTDLRIELADADATPSFVVASEAMRDVLARIDRAASLSYPVLILGETGVGKEGLARRLHARSCRSGGPFVAINCGAIAPELAASELFGHERGAFTGALALRLGAFEQAERGTLFLDEVGELSLDLQARFLRVLEGYEIRRLGGERARPVDVRIVCATHRSLPAMVAQGSFRADLFYRLSPLPIVVPPLRERPDDVLPIAYALLGALAGELGPRGLTREAEAVLLAHGFPGNVRELKNLLVAAAMGSPVPTLDAADLRGTGLRFEDATPLSVEGALSACRGNVAATARALGLSRTTLRDRLRRARQ